jgi:hypothetical protein
MMNDMQMDAAYDEWLDSLSPEEIVALNAILDAADADECGVTIVADEPTVECTDEPKAASVTAEKVKCKCCGFHKKARRVNAEGVCKVCYVALATSEPGEAVVVVGRQGKKGRNAVSVMIGGERVKVLRKVRIDA